MEPHKISTINMLVGIPASGKSTWALEQMKKYPGKYKRTNRDSLRAMLDGDRHDWNNEKFVVALRDTIVERALRAGFDAIVDDTNFPEKNWTAMCNIARRVGNVRVMEKYFPVDLKEAQKRNAARPKPVPADVVENFFKKYINNKQVEVRDEFFPMPSPEATVSDPEKIDAIICDIDGTVAVHGGRSPYDMTKLLDDKPNEPICDLVRIIAQKIPVIFASGREDCGREDTVTWLQANDLPYADLFMRKTGDGRKDVIIKREIYERDVSPKYNVKFVLDDRKQVVDECWRAMGLCCLQVAPGEF
jgi:predicted kinase